MYPDYEKLHNSYSLQNNVKSRKTEWARHAARMEEITNEYKMSFGKPEEVTWKQRSRCANIKMCHESEGAEENIWTKER
jgi:uncharacterized protein (DUF2132 family)